MRPILTLLRTFLVLSVIAAIASAIAASVAKGRMISKGEPADDELDLVAIYEPRNFASTAAAFRRGTYTAWYGGGTLDFRGATLDPAGATLTVRAIFGGFRLVVPATWRVEVQAAGVMGGIGDTRSKDQVAAEGPVLRIDGFAIFGGVGIVSEAPDLEVAVEAEALPVEPVLAPA